MKDNPEGKTNEYRSPDGTVNITESIKPLPEHPNGLNGTGYEKSYNQTYNKGNSSGQVIKMESEWHGGSGGNLNETALNMRMDAFEKEFQDFRDQT